jgi:hypothetical protein
LKTKSLSLYSENFLPGLISYAAILFGIWFLGWSSSDLLYYIFLEMLIFGVAMAIRILFSGKAIISDTSTFKRILQNLLMTWSFTTAYGVMLIVFIVFILSALTPEWGEMDASAYGLTFWALIMAYGADLLFNYFGSKQYVETSGIQVIFRSIFRTLPFIVISVFIIVKLADLFPGNNEVLLTGILGVRVLLDYIAFRLSKWLGFQQFMGKNNSVHNARNKKQSEL